MFVAKSDNSGPITNETVVGLRIGGVTRFVVRTRVRIGSGKIEDTLAGHAEPVGSADGHQIPQIVGPSTKGIKGLSSWKRGDEQGSELGERELRGVVPSVIRLLLSGDTHIGVLIP